MTDEKKPEQTPREIIARLAAMSPEEFNQFMGRHFDSLCGQTLASGRKKHPMSECNHIWATQDEQGRSFCAECGEPWRPGFHVYETGNKRYPREEDDENNEEGA